MLPFFVAADQMLAVTLQKPRALGSLSHRQPTGVYELQLTWKGPSAVDLLIDGHLYEESYTGEIRARVLGQAGVRLELQMHAYHLPYLAEPFELTASILSGP